MVVQGGERWGRDRRTPRLTGAWQAGTIDCWSACQTHHVSSIWSKHTLHCGCSHGLRLCGILNTTRQFFTERLRNCSLPRTCVHSSGLCFSLLFFFFYSLSTVLSSHSSQVVAFRCQAKTSVCFFGKVLLCRGAPFTACWPGSFASHSAALEKATLQSASGDKTLCDAL